jgi:outer membrane immunogenic protein
MKKYSLPPIAALLFATHPVFAADMPVKVPLYKAPPPVVYGWTGCYIGANGGYTWRTGKSSYEDDPNTMRDPINSAPSNVLLFPATIPVPGNTNGKGWIGGGEVGCNWQMNRRVVFGFEADIDGVRASGSDSTTVVVARTAGFQVGPSLGLELPSQGGTANEQVSLRWLSTIRARAGLPVMADRGLLYLTGGLVLGGVSSSGFVNLTSSVIPNTLTWGGSNSTTRTGYTVGGGFEYAAIGRRRPNIFGTTSVRPVIRLTSLQIILVSLPHYFTRPLATRSPRFAATSFAWA